MKHPGLVNSDCDSNTMKTVYSIYTDGGYFEKQDIGGWGLVIFQDDKEIHRASGWQKKTSSLEMELTAAQKALEFLPEITPNTSSSCTTLYTDSRILIEGLTEKYELWCQNQWQVKSGKSVVYKHLWQSLSRLGEQQQIKWQWVKGHNGNIGNTLADNLAREAVTNRTNPLS